MTASWLWQHAEAGLTAISSELPPSDVPCARLTHGIADNQDMQDATTTMELRLQLRGLDWVLLLGQVSTPDSCALP